MNDLAKRGEIQRYVQKAFLAKIMQMNEVRRQREADLHASLAARGHGRNGSASIIGEVDIEEDCIAELLHQKADLFLEAYQRNGMKIGREVLSDIAHSQVEIVAARKSSLMAQAQLVARRTATNSRAHAYAHLGKKASVAMKEIEAKIDLHNLTPKKAEPVTVMNVSYHLSGTGNRVVHGDDRSVNIINEQELFTRLTEVVSASVHDETERAEILARLEDLKHEKTKADYLGMVTKFITAASSIGHVISPYLPALIEKAESLL